MEKKITFLPDKVTIAVDSGENLLTAAAAAGVYIHAFCGGEGVCGKCRVAIREGEAFSERGLLKEEDYTAGIRLACRTSVISDLVVEVPTEVDSAGRPLPRKPKTTRTIAVRTLAEIIGGWGLKPPVRKHFIRLDPPSSADNMPDMQRLLLALTRDSNQGQEPLYDHPELLQELPFILREADWQVTVLLLRGQMEHEPERIIAIEPGDTTDQLFGLAIDLGTTTVSGLLVDLNTGETVAEASTYNGQIAYGEDVIARIIYAQRSDGLRVLRKRAVYTINDIIDSVCRDTLISPADISYIVAAGNTVMSHLLLGINPKFLREAPYVPVCGRFPLTVASSIGIMAHPAVRLFLYPAVASYVGGDIVSGVHACRMHESDKLTLYIDIGTNGEIVVGNREWMLCAACSAGPAFEGGGIRYGIRAVSGAIENFQLHPQTLEPMIITIGQSKARGICGSGLISIVAELLEARVIDRQGKFDRSVSHLRIREGRDGFEYVLVWSEDSLVNEDIVISEVDIENLIRAKGAMYAGYQTLIESVEMSFMDLERIIIAGNFGAYLDLEKAIRIGLLPDLDRNKFFYLGNGSLLGAQISLLDCNRFLQHTEVSSLITNMELSENPRFMDHYVASLFLPHTDLDLFPSAAGGSVE